MSLLFISFKNLSTGILFIPVIVLILTYLGTVLVFHLNHLNNLPFDHRTWHCADTLYHHHTSSYIVSKVFLTRHSNSSVYTHTISFMLSYLKLFSFDHCIVCPSISGFWLLLWYLQTFFYTRQLYNVVLYYIPCYHTWIIFWWNEYFLTVGWWVGLWVYYVTFRESFEDTKGVIRRTDNTITRRKTTKAQMMTKHSLDNL